GLEQLHTYNFRRNNGVSESSSKVLRISAVRQPSTLSPLSMPSTPLNPTYHKKNLPGIRL
ncbi:hypothetical protein PIB30_115267, partial [Stylosanthes scabra]|nr:hypothetical protein [Stylosanthes scabra]